MSRSVFTGFVLVLCLVIPNHSVSAQTNEHKAEVGGLFTVVSLTDFQERLFPSIGNGSDVMSGVGGRFGYNFHKYVALDAEVNFFPESHLANEEFGQKMQGFIGVKAGVRNDKVGVFAKARPGVMWFGEFSSRGGCSSTAFGSVCGVSHEKDFAMDLGGVFEYYPTDRLIVRADVGDTIIRYQERQTRIGSLPVLVPAATKNNLQISLGIGWRF
jgi:hypothetical protein